MSSSQSIRRVFIGTFLSSEQQQSLAELKALHPNLPELWHMKLRWVKAKKLHLTWLFIGNIDEAALLAIKNKLGEIVSHHRYMTLSYEHGEFWPSPKKARQLVLVPQVISQEAMALFKSISSELSNFVTKHDEQQFRPHITLLRLEHFRYDFSMTMPRCLPEVTDLSKLERYLPLVQKIDSVSLIESHLGGQGDDYLPVERFLLRPFA